MQISTALPVNHIVSNNALQQPPIIQQNYQQPQVQIIVSFLNGQLAPLFQSTMVATKKYKILINSHLMTWLWHINIFASLEILLSGYYNILMHLKMSISIYDQFVSEPDISTSVTLGLIYHFKCSSLFPHCTFRDYYPSFTGLHEIHISYIWNFFPDQDFFCLLSFHDYCYFRVKFFGFCDVFNVSCIIILGN